MVCAALALPMAASAGTAPALTIDTSPIKTTGSPVFNWSLGPAGEYLRTITVSKSSALSSAGYLSPGEDGEVLRSIAGVTTQKSGQRYRMGTWYFQGSWYSKADVRPSENGATPVGTFVVSPMIHSARAKVYSQQNRGTQLRGQIKYVANMPTTKVVCRIMNGRGIVASQTVVERDTNTSTVATEYCYLTVPEKLDGKRLKLVAVISGGGKKTTSSTTFTAR